MKHFYPENYKIELDYERLTIGKITEPFIVFIFMSILALVGLVAEIIFDKVSSMRLNKNIVEANKNKNIDAKRKIFKVGFIVNIVNDTTTHLKFREKFDILFSQFDVKNFCEKKVGQAQ
jgi:hypothetical protein